MQISFRSADFAGPKVNSFPFGVKLGVNSKAGALGGIQSGDLGSAPSAPIRAHSPVGIFKRGAVFARPTPIEAFWDTAAWRSFTARVSLVRLARGRYGTRHG